MSFFCLCLVCLFSANPSRLKLKRPQAAKAFRKQIDDMYAEIKGNEKIKAKI